MERGREKEMVRGGKGREREREREEKRKGRKAFCTHLSVVMLLLSYNLPVIVRAETC